MFPSLGGSSGLKLISYNLDVQSVERLPIIKVSKEMHVFSDVEIAETRKQWGPTLLGVVLGSSLTHAGIESFDRRAWVEHLPSVSSLLNGVFQFRFSGYDDLN